MRQAVYRSPGHLDLVESADPDVGADDVLLGVEACGVCGSDVASYLLGHYAGDGQVLGHEMSCVVLAAGGNVPLAAGTRVAVCPARACGSCAYCTGNQPGLCGESGSMTLGYGVPGGFADRVLYPAPVVGRDLYPMPAEVSALDVLWCEPLAVAVRAVRRALAAAAGARHLAVLGAGSVGLCVAAAAPHLGVDRVSVVEPREQRRAAGATLPGVHAFASLTEALAADLRGIDVVIDSSGSTAALAAVPALTPLLLVGLGDGPVPWPRDGVHTSFAYSADDFSTAVGLVASGAVRLGSLVTHTFELGSTGAGIAASARDPEAVKVVITP